MTAPRGPGGHHGGVGATPKAERPRTLAEAYALAASRGALRPWTPTAEPGAGFGVLDLRDSTSVEAPEPAPAAPVLDDPGPSADGAARPLVEVVEIDELDELDELDPAEPPRRDRRTVGTNLAIAAGIALVGISAWNLSRDDPLPAAGTPAAETGTSEADPGTTRPLVTVTTSTSLATTTTSPTTAPAPTTTVRSTPTTRRPSGAAPAPTTPTTARTTTTTAAPAPPTTAEVTTTTGPEPPPTTGTTAPPDDSGT
jgi:hypothetical protein